MHPEFAPVAIIAAASLLLPLPWHWRAKNIATLSIVVWLFAVNIIYAVDALVWGNNVRIVMKIWCDITTKLLIGSNFALPAACLCISMHLERVASVRSARPAFSDKRYRQIFEACMCFGLPLIFMALHYVVQGHRFDIIEEYGCRPTTYISIPGIFIVYVPPLVMATASLIFSALALRHFLQRRIAFALHLQNSNSALTTSRYFRLMLMSFFQMTTSITITSLNLWFTLMAVPMRPWTNWADVHSDWLRIDQYLTLFTPPIVVRSFYALWWTIPFSTFIFVVFFAFGKEAMDEYKRCFFWVQRTIFRYQPISGTSSKSSFLQRVPQKLAFPGFWRPKTSDSTKMTTTSTSMSLPQYNYPRAPAPPKYLGNLNDSDSSICHPSLDAYPLPETPSTCSPTTAPRYIQDPSSLPMPSNWLITSSDGENATSSVSRLGVLSCYANEYGSDADTTACSPSSPPRPVSPLPPPPPSHPRVRPKPAISDAGIQSSAPLRPLTYPSFDACQRGFHTSFLPSTQL